MATFPEAEARMFKDIYVCRKCKSKMRVPIGKVLSGKAVCRNCGSKDLRPIRKIAKK